MNVCIPVNEDKGLESRVCAHFGSAPAFVVVDTETGACRAIVNQNQHHGHGQCAPLASLQGQGIDAVVVGGIGMGALGKLQAAGMAVHRSVHATVAEAVDALKAGTLPAMDAQSACAHHGHDHG
jgi:predicted Fe-Mo cluster-binding NifX family protein